jgi:hypothetical protein
MVRSRITCLQRDFQAAVGFAREARQAAEAHGLSSFNLFATSLEALARAEAGEKQMGVHLAMNALGAIDAIQGSEYGIEIRARSYEALKVASSQHTAAAREKAAAHIRSVADAIRDARLRSLFLARPIVTNVLGESTDGPAAGHATP